MSQTVGTRVATGDAALAAEVAPLVAFMAVGMACVGVMYVPYNLQLASGHPRRSLNPFVFPTCLPSHPTGAFR